MFISISSSSKSIIIISMVSDMSDIVSDILCLIFPISCLNCVWYMWWQVRTKCSKCRNIIDLEGLAHHPHHHHHHHHQDHRRYHHCHHEMVLGKLGLGPTVGHRGPTVHFFWADCWAPDLLSYSFGVWVILLLLLMFLSRHQADCGRERVPQEMFLLQEMLGPIGKGKGWQSHLPVTKSSTTTTTTTTTIMIRFMETRTTTTTASPATLKWRQSTAQIAPRSTTNHNIIL